MLLRMPLWGSILSAMISDASFVINFRDLESPKLAESVESLIRANWCR
jgi:hypothetical protein